MGTTIKLFLEKLKSNLAMPVEYCVVLENKKHLLNPFLGKKFIFAYTGKIKCTHCGRSIKKTFNQAHCFPCFQKLASCDMCIVKPELCHYANGTCREPKWGEDNCLRPHIVYLANASGVKIGITREVQVPFRWIDQGASEALPLFRVSSRLLSGQVEVLFKNFVADKTNWRNMLKGEVPAVDLLGERKSLMEKAQEGMQNLQKIWGPGAIEILENEPVVKIQYPVLEYPKKITSLDLEKTSKIEGVLLGIKGQYLIWDIGVLNVRKFTGYEVEMIGAD